MSASALYGGRGIELVSGTGGTVRDSSGREYIDFFNGHGAALFGHGNSRLQAALAEGAAGVWSPGAGFENAHRDRLMALLEGILPDGRVFLSNSGAEAIEAALKLTVALRPGRERILACRRAFHGRTTGALALTFNPNYRKPFASILAKVEHYAPEDLPEKIDSNVAAVFIEPVQGEGGVYPLSVEMGRRLSDACAASGALLVADEIQTGMGRCGAFLGGALVGLDSDIVCLAKGLAGGLPIGATVWKGVLGDFPSQTHGSTYGGNALVCRVAAEAVEMLQQDHLAEWATSYGERLQRGLRSIKNENIVAVRGMGLLVGVEVKGPSIPLVRGMQEEGVLCLPAGPRVLRFLPSYASGEKHIDAVVAAVARVMESIPA